MLEQLIRKGGLRRIATAIPATPATEMAKNTSTVASVATVAVATKKAKQPKAARAVSIDLIDFAERASALELGAGMGRVQAEQAAAIEFGYAHAVAFYEAILVDWRGRMLRISENLTTQRGKQILRDAVAFLEEWGLTALQIGWDEQDLFRCTSHDLQAIGARPLTGKKPQLQRLGLIFFIQCGRVELITRETASIRTSGGQLQSFPHFGPGHNQGAPIWEVAENIRRSSRGEETIERTKK